MKTHMNFATTDIEQSVSFYTTLFGAAPTRRLEDYALFIVDEPELELALDLRDRVEISRDAHYGICVETAEDVERAIARLGILVTSVERAETCCYANQTKAWATDPDGRRWEVYTVHEETEERDGTTCCADQSDLGSCCADQSDLRSCCAA